MYLRTSFLSRSIEKSPGDCSVISLLGAFIIFHLLFRFIFPSGNAVYASSPNKRHIADTVNESFSRRIAVDRLSRLMISLPAMMSTKQMFTARHTDLFDSKLPPCEFIATDIDSLLDMTTATRQNFPEAQDELLTNTDTSFSFTQLNDDCDLTKPWLFEFNDAYGNIYGKHTTRYGFIYGIGKGSEKGTTVSHIQYAITVNLKQNTAVKFLAGLNRTNRNRSVDEAVFLSVNLKWLSAYRGKLRFFIHGGPGMYWGGSFTAGGNAGGGVQFSWYPRFDIVTGFDVQRKNLFTGKSGLIWQIGLLFK